MAEPTAQALLKRIEALEKLAAEQEQINAFNEAQVTSTRDSLHQLVLHLEMATEAMNKLRREWHTNYRNLAIEKGWIKP